MTPNTNADVTVQSLRLLKPLETAALLRVSYKTLERWRADGHGPSFFVFGSRTIRYAPDDLAAWVARGRRPAGAIRAEGAAS